MHNVWTKGDYLAILEDTFKALHSLETIIVSLFVHHLGVKQLFYLSKSNSIIKMMVYEIIILYDIEICKTQLWCT